MSQPRKSRLLEDWGLLFPSVKILSCLLFFVNFCKNLVKLFIQGMTTTTTHVRRQAEAILRRISFLTIIKHLKQVLNHQCLLIECLNEGLRLKLLKPGWTLTSIDMRWSNFATWILYWIEMIFCPTLLRLSFVKRANAHYRERIKRPSIYTFLDWRTWEEIEVALSVIWVEAIFSSSQCTKREKKEKREYRVLLLSMLTFCKFFDYNLKSR